MSWTNGSCYAASSSASTVGSTVIATRLDLGRVITTDTTLGSVASACIV